MPLVQKINLSKSKQNKWSSREEMDYGYISDGNKLHISLNVKFQIGDVK